MSKTEKAADAVKAYLSIRDRSARITHLAEMGKRGDTMPISMAEDLLELPLGHEEQIKILEATGSEDRLALEHFYTRSLTTWPQELASLAILLWRDHTDHLMWYQFYMHADDPMLSQRVRYTLLDNLWHTGGRKVFDKILGVDGLEDLSPAYHGLLLHRAIEWDVCDQRLDALTASILAGLSGHLHPDNKAVISALAYTARFHPGELNHWVKSPAVAEPWRDTVRGYLNAQENFERQHEKLAKFVAKAPKSKVKEKFYVLWPAAWQRHALSPTCIADSLRLFLDHPMEDAPANSRRLRVSQPFEFFGGIKESDLLSIVKGLDGECFAKALATLGSLLPMTMDAELIAKVKDTVAAADDPGRCLELLPMRVRIELTTDTKDSTSPYAKLQCDAASTLQDQPAKADFRDYTTEQDQDLADRKAFFAAYKGMPTASFANRSSYWTELHRAWLAPEKEQLDHLASLARQQEGPFRICYLDTLSRFEGHDEAVLKVLDFIRSKEEDDVRAVIRALRGIGTSRATQELVASLTRPNISHTQRLEICAVLQDMDMRGLQKELRSAMNDLTVDPDVGSSSYEVRESLSALLEPVESGPSTSRPAGKKQTGLEVDASDYALDQLLAGKIQHYKDLSSEVKRALRTAQFFHMQVSGNGAPESIDLSPVIDMQYKSLELFFRESFEDHCSRLIHKGILQRRLDVIGYARPIPRSMDEFENYVSSLPTIRDIPFFSKFKLRKMLRAICQFRPGRRFTLDGLKAFALFFLCFSRRECRYGLESLFPMGFESDRTLFDFCKSLHVLQDARNRAAHEGFHPDSSNDIDGIWQATAEIIQTVFQITPNLSAGVEDYAPKNRSTPVIEKKVS